MAKKKTKRKSSKKKTDLQSQNSRGGEGRTQDGQSAVGAVGAVSAVGAVAEEKAELKWAPYLVGLLVFLVATPAIVGPYGQKDGYSPDLHMSAYIQVGALVVLSFFLLSTFSRQRVSVYRSPIVLPLALFYSWAMLSVLWANTQYEAVIEALDWSGAFFTALLVVLILRNSKQIRILLFLMVISGLLMALLGVGQYLLGIDWVHQHVVPAATFANKNMAGQYGILTFPLAVGFFLYTRKVAFVWFHALIISLIMTYIFYTKARGAWLGFFLEVGVLVAILIYARYKKDLRFFSDMPIKKVALAASIALFLGMSYLTPTMLGNQKEVLAASIGAKPPQLTAQTGFEVLELVTDGTESSANKRFTIWSNSMGMFRDHFLIGVGLGNWTIHYAKYQSSFKQDQELLKNRFHANAHNDYVEILCELGIIGFALFLWVAFAFFKLIRGLLARQQGKDILFTACLVAALSGIALNAVFSFPLKQPVPIFIILVYMAVLSNLYGVSAGEGRSHVLSLPPPPVKAVGTILVLAAAIGMFIFQSNLYRSEVYYRHATVALEKQRFEEAYQKARLAYEFNSMRQLLLWLEATALMQLRRKESFDEVIALFEKVERSYPYSSNALINLATVYNIQGRYEDSSRSFERLLSVQIGNSLTYGSAMALFNAGKVKDSIERFEGMILPRRIDFYENLSNYESRMREAFYGYEDYASSFMETRDEVESRQNKMKFVQILIHYMKLWDQEMKGVNQENVLEMPTKN